MELLGFAGRTVTADAVVQGLAWATAAVAGLPTAMLALECLAGTRKRASKEVGEVPPFIIIMPAHDEAAGIEAAIRAAHAQLRSNDELLVVADNCSDDTAARARGLGATVIERHDAERRGKGHALEYGRAFIAAHRPDVRAVLVFDADCRALPGSLPTLAAKAARCDAAVQGIFLLAASPDAGPVVRISGFAFLIKNLVRQQGLARLSGAALLHGSGMAFPRTMFLAMRWRGGSLVEDLEMGLDLLLAGQRVVVAPDARILSASSSIEGTGGQRRRWEHGMMQTAWRYVPRLLARAVRRPSLTLVACDLMVPPTVLLALCSFAALCVVLALAGPSGPFLALMAVQVAAAVGVARAWWRCGREILPPSSLRDLPAYVAWKLPLIVQFITDRQREWTRTERLP
ncbi:glycosyltransferase family 2 protein [Novosphingobium guangzhouense]|uniref:Glycosyl transferase n=1 Tax=Novosphingobium guangzhouense TaxID=1850347 RepID=A0A2K2FZZ1_9SPHN|nr:glycosyltransferase [Novosphingobium guangzhouense]PNU04332.1 glycosyl transferase [Novosphingobium guangzhouense]